MKKYTTKRDVTNLGYIIIGFAIKVHKTLGPGLLESIYEACMVYELEKNGYYVAQQIVVPIIYDGVIIKKSALRFDLLVENTVLVELKSQEIVATISDAQLIS
jgi:GxxExxY protein